MTQTPTKRRTGMSAVRPPLRRDHKRRDLMMAAGVGFSMLVIITLYAASFPKLDATQYAELPRWDTVRDEAFAGFAPAAERLSGLRKNFRAVVEAKSAQAESIAILKDKIASATAVPATPPENPNP